MASERTIHRLEAQIQRRIAHCFQFELADPRGAFLTVVRVELNSDLSVAKVYYSVLGSESDRAKTAQMLDHAKGFIRRQVAGILKTRTVPDLRFLEDESMADAERMDELISEARKRDRELRGGAGSGSSGPGPESSGPDPKD